jgi:hypothetical protein
MLSLGKTPVKQRQLIIRTTKTFSRHQMLTQFEDNTPPDSM